MDSQSGRTDSEVVGLPRNARGADAPRRALASFGRNAASIALAVMPAIAQGGAPFRTDDPVVIAPGHFEFLPFYAQTLAASGRSGALPALEIHYGALDRVELDLAVQQAFNTPSGARTQYGFGDTVIGIKYQIAKEAESVPMVGFVPKVVLPTGNSERGLGNGGSQIFVPLWLQKSIGNFTTYGGGGYFFNNGAGNRNYWFFGWEAQYQFSDRWTLGGEVFHSTAQTDTQPASTGFSLGGFYRIDDASQLLFSIGKGIQNAAQTNRITTYIGYLYSY